MRRSSMKPPFVAVLPLMLALGCAAPAAASTSEQAGDAAHDARMAWWREARFGMFIHWGLYAVPAGTWGDDTGHGEWIYTTAQIPLERYERFREQFNPVAFDADAWVRMAKNAGMKYIVITTKHHDGFGLFDSRHTDYDVMSTPFGRDILRELSEACARHGLRMCWYHSIMDWHHPDYLPRRDWEARGAAGADFERYERYLHDQVTELLTSYGPIGVMWFDGEWERTWNHERGVRLYELCRRLQPDVIVNNRVDVWRGGMAGFSQSQEAVGDFGTPEQEIPATGVPGVDWETCMTMNGHWGYNRHDKNFKSTRELIRMLVDIASKGGNYLLNVGPQANGEFPPESVQRLEEIGRWMAVNGAAIYGTQASPFAALPWGRCTQRGDRLYLHVFDWPADGMLTVPGLGNEPRAVRLLADAGRAVAWERVASDLRLSVGRRAPDADCSVVELVLDGAPIVYRAPEITAEADIFVRRARVRVASAAPELEARYTLDGSEPSARSPRGGDWIQLDDSAVVRARSFHRGRAVGEVAERRFTRVAPRPAAELGPSVQVHALQRAVYRGDWNRLPDFTALAPAETGMSEHIAPLAEEYVGLVYQGHVLFPEDEVYTFILNADDGARLWIGEQLVVDNDGLHAPEERRGQIALARGHHPVRVEWFNKTGGYELSLQVHAPGDAPHPLADWPLLPVTRP